MNLQTLLPVLVLLLIFHSTTAFFTIVPTGNVGVKTSWGVIVEEILLPGVNLYNLLTEMINIVDVKLQTDKVDNVECGTADGVKITIKKIEIGNQLSIDNVYHVISRYGFDYDKYLVTDLVVHQINVICSKLSAHELAIEKFSEIDDFLLSSLQEENDRRGTGLKFTFVRLTKPELPVSLNANYLKLAEEKLQKKVVMEQNERIKSEKDIQKMVQERDNDMLKQKIGSDNEIIIMNAETKKKQESVYNEITINEAIAKKEAMIHEIEWKKELYSIPGYVSVKIAESTANNMKIYYGEKLPQTLVGTGFNLGGTEYNQEYQPISDMLKNQQMSA